MAEQEHQEIPPTDPGMGWKDWAIGALWLVSMALAGAGWASMDKTLNKMVECQTAQVQAFNDYKLENEKRWGIVWRTMDKICSYQSERLHKEGKTPDYHIQIPGK